MREDEHTHFVSAFRFTLSQLENMTFKHTHTHRRTREGYSQAQNTRAEFILQPD